jgi:hypothetical protein
MSVESSLNSNPYELELIHFSSRRINMCEPIDTTSEYEVPKIITYTDDEILEELGPALTVKLNF